MKGTVKEIMVGNYAITEPICLLETAEGEQRLNYDAKMACP